MRLFVMVVAMLVAGCAAQTPAPRTAERHAANIAAAERAGYKIISHGDRTIFCPTAAPTGSHMGPTCLTESELEAQLGMPRYMTPAAHVTKQPPGPGPGAGH